MNQHLTNLFNKFDKNSDGKVSLACFKKLIKLTDPQDNLQDITIKKQYTLHDLIAHIGSKPNFVQLDKVKKIMSQYLDQDTLDIINDNICTCSNKDNQLVNIDEFISTIESIDLS